MRFGPVALFFSLLFVISCGVQQSRTPSIGELFAGPSSLPIRQEIAPKSPVRAIAKHGDRLEVLEYKRRFVKVRTAEGKEGWTDTRLLLTPDQMSELRTMAKNASKAPSQGAATVFEALNMHTAPSRTSPSFLQIPENGKVDVIAHKLTPRVQQQLETTPVKVVRTRQTSKRSRHKQSSSSKIPPPPPPPAPAPPQNWLALSQPTSKSIPVSDKDAQKPPAPVPMDDWSLVRTSDGKVGWVLTRMLSMAIPDEVAQYAEGHRITSYFPLAQVHDGEGVKNDWLWTTITKGQEPYEFDSFRVFIWSRNHHRYETAYIERNVVGHYPIQVDTSGDAPRFSVLVEGMDDRLYKKTYVLEGNRVRFIDRTPVEQTASSDGTQVLASSQPVNSSAPLESWLSRMKQSVQKLFR